MATVLGGLRGMTRTPSLIWVVDTNKEHLAVNEARKLGIPVVGILDTNCDPDVVDYAIPGNDDALRSVDLLTKVIADAVAEGLIARAGIAAEADTVAADEPLAAWEQELLAAQAVATEAPAADAAPAEVPAAAEEAPAEAAATESDAPAEAAPVTETAEA